MDGVAVVRSVLTADAGITAIVPVSRIVADDALPQGIGLSAILIKLITGVDRNIPHQSASVFRTDRVRIEGHARTMPEREQVMMAIWQALQNNQRPLSAVTLNTEARGPDGISDASVRVGIQDCKVSYPKER